MFHERETVNQVVFRGHQVEFTVSLATQERMFPLDVPSMSLDEGTHFFQRLSLHIEEGIFQGESTDGIVVGKGVDLRVVFSQRHCVVMHSDPPFPICRCVKESGLNRKAFSHVRFSVELKLISQTLIFI